MKCCEYCTRYPCHYALLFCNYIFKKLEKMNIFENPNLPFYTLLSVLTPAILCYKTFALPHSGLYQPIKFLIGD